MPHKRLICYLLVDVFLYCLLTQMSLKCVNYSMLLTLDRTHQKSFFFLNNMWDVLVKPFN